MNKDISYGAWSTLYYLFDLNEERKRIQSLDNILDLIEEFKQACKEATTTGADEIYKYGEEAEEYIKKCKRNYISYNQLKRDAKEYGAPVSENTLS